MWHLHLFMMRLSAAPACMSVLLIATLIITQLAVIDDVSEMNYYNTINNSRRARVQIRAHLQITKSNLRETKLLLSKKTN